LDTNLDKKPGKNPASKLIATTWGTLLIILFLTIVFVGSYAPIKDYAVDPRDHVEQYIENRSLHLANTLADMTTYLVVRENLLQIPSEGSIDFSFSFNRIYTSNVQSIKYYLTNEEQTFAASNMSESTVHNLQQEIANSRFYLTAKFDEYGNPTVESSQDENFNNHFINGLLNRSIIHRDRSNVTTNIAIFNHATGTTAEVLEINHNIDTHIEVAQVHHDTGITLEVIETNNTSRTIIESLEFGHSTEAMIRRDNTFIEEITILEAMANLEVTFIIPGNDILAIYSDFFTNEIKASTYHPYLILILKIAAVSILLLMIIAFAIPFSSQKQVPIVNLFNEKLPLEFKALLWFGFMLGATLIVRITDTWWHNPGAAHNYINMIFDANHFFYLIGIPMTFIFCLLIYLSICYLKYIYHEGIKEGLVKNTLTVKILYGIKKLTLKSIGSINELTRQIIETDMTAEYHKKFMLILAINLAAIWVLWATIASLGIIGIILSIAYTFFLFRYFIKVLDKVRTLNFATKELAQGDFNIEIKEELGILSPIADNLNNIKAGFKIAVEKEVRSQNFKNELITNVSHDLKTPLTSIITYVDLLKNENTTPEDQKEYIEILDRKSQRLKVLIEDLFEASKASSGNIELYPENLDVVFLLKQSLGELEEKINNSTLDIKVNAPENKVICRLDGQKTYRIFENILSNILKFSMPNSRVYIDVSENEKEVSFIFKNISAYEMNFDASEITERFTRGDTARTTEGSGLGLAIAKSLVELQNGHMNITIDGDLFKLTVSFTKSQQDEKQ